MQCRSTFLTVTTALVMTLSANAGLSAAPQLLPHLAVYELSLGSATERSGISGVQGRMVYEFRGSPCEGYTVTYRFVSRINAGGQWRTTDQQTTSFETADGNEYNFSTRSFVDQAADTEIKGVARQEKGETRVEVEKPDAGEFELPATKFPTQHLLEVIKSAQTDRKFYEQTIFDGSDDANELMSTTVAIGNAETASANDPEAKALGAHKEEKVWPVDIAYFDAAQTQNVDETPKYRTTFKLHENGVTRDLMMDYGEFSILGKLVEFKPIEQSNNCDKKPE
ncbi:cell envelope integrity EipB family protein [Limoniibacter endophyticus]|uniref:ATP-binding protein n=1 Tax=Limoniibacter endophyticus TaxID=1565040 RepID=A0A8J3DP15_9HYPH|nr:cell envelope integrity EipB family protein [Limoniibacter endophyticus]GHC62135.1 ATP-binding protein [Limoniibacter endophyticus]